MALIDCPDCGKALVDEKDSCALCGWPHAQQELAKGTAAAAAPPPVAAGSNPMTYLLVGLVVGLGAGYLLGSMSSKGAGTEGGREDTAASKGGAICSTISGAA